MCALRGYYVIYATLFKGRLSAVRDLLIGIQLEKPTPNAFTAHDIVFYCFIYRSIIHVKSVKRGRRAWLHIYIEQCWQMYFCAIRKICYGFNEWKICEVIDWIFCENSRTALIDPTSFLIIKNIFLISDFF